MARAFPAVCALLTLLFYLMAYSNLEEYRPPTAAVAHGTTPVEHVGLAERSHAVSDVTALNRRREAPLPMQMNADSGAGKQQEAALDEQPASAVRAALVLDGTLEAALHYAVPAGSRKFLLLTFGNLGVKDQLLNFVTHAKRANVAHLVGGVDVGAFDLMVAQGSAAYKTPLAAERYSMDGSNQHSSSSWKRFAGMRTGEVAKIVSMGYTVMHTDCDVVWLQDPMPYIMCDEGAWKRASSTVSERFPCKPLLEADVAVSSDNMSPDRDAQGHASYSAGGTFNTGLLLVRATPQGTRFAKEWHRLVVEPPRGSRFAALTSDQQVFNHMMRRPNEWPGISAPHGAWVMDAWDRSLRLGALPLPLFINGHGYFVQAAHIRLKVPPLAVHATYSLDNHDAIAKRQRFREAGLWAADTEGYFTTEPGYLALNGSMSPALLAKIDAYVAKGKPAFNIDVHGFALSEYVKELRDALALAHILKRTLILPRWTCYCDRLWSGSDDIFHFGCMYPGAQDGKFVPFVCPMDHVLSPSAWARAKQPYRDPSFMLKRPPGKLIDVELVPREKYSAATAGSSSAIRLPLGASAEEVRSALGHVPATFIRLPHARGLLCGVGDAKETNHVNSLSAQLLRVPQWCAKCFQPCATELAQWLGPEEIRRSSMGASFFCLQVPLPPSFRTGECVLNGVLS